VGLTFLVVGLFAAAAVLMTPGIPGTALFIFLAVYVIGTGGALFAIYSLGTSAAAVTLGGAVVLGAIPFVTVVLVDLLAGDGQLQTIKLTANNVASWNGLLFSGVVGSFAGVMRGRTPEGQQVVEMIEGYRLYLETAQAPRLAATDLPEKTPERFDHEFAYAVALDVSRRWSDEFTSYFQYTEEPEVYQRAFERSSLDRELRAKTAAKSNGPR
jgi:hypothetical protein